MTTPDFPILDAPRTEANAELFRLVVDYLGVIEPHVDELDSYVSMPLRLVHNAATGFCLEAGPYDLDHNDIGRLRAAIAAYDDATGNEWKRA